MPLLIMKKSYSWQSVSPNSILGREKFLMVITRTHLWETMFVNQVHTPLLRRRTYTIAIFYKTSELCLKVSIDIHVLSTLNNGLHTVLSPRSFFTALMGS
jgi:hypothetical protein